MVKYYSDKTGRFKQRPYYEQPELDRECEIIIRRLLERRHGSVKLPVSTEDLHVLIEQDADVLDPYADLSADGPTVEGVTEFRRGLRPIVKISQELSSDPRRENRFRMTLAHEYGHVRFHDPVFQAADPTRDLYRSPNRPDRIVCKRDNIYDAPETDWMEWQAGYAAGALLMPITQLRRAVGDFLEANGLYGALDVNSAEGYALGKDIARLFQVSDDAARVRLKKLGLISSAQTQPSLFG